MTAWYASATRMGARASRPLGGVAHMPNNGMYAPPATHRPTPHFHLLGWVEGPWPTQNDTLRRRAAATYDGRE